MYTTTLLAAEQSINITIGPEAVIGAVVTLFLAVLAAAIAWGKLTSDVKNVSTNVDALKIDIDKDIDDLKNDNKAFRADIASLKALVQRDVQRDYAVANSPRKLTERGAHLLKQSGIKAAIDSNKDELLTLVQDKHPQTAYDAELCVMNVVEAYFKNNEQLNNTIKEKTFELGENIEIVYFVGGIYLRDYALPKMDFKLADIDKGQAKKK